MLVCPHSSCACPRRRRRSLRRPNGQCRCRCQSRRRPARDAEEAAVCTTLAQFVWNSELCRCCSAAAALLLLTTSPATERPTDFGCHLLFHFPSRCRRRCRERKKGPLKMRCPFPLLLSCSLVVVVIRQQLLFFGVCVCVCCLDVKYCCCFCYYCRSCCNYNTTAAAALESSQGQETSGKHISVCVNESV